MRRVRGRTGHEFRVVKGPGYSRQWVRKNIPPQVCLLAYSLAKRGNGGLWFRKGKFSWNKGETC